jgi:hypothetical protein
MPCPEGMRPKGASPSGDFGDLEFVIIFAALINEAKSSES